MKDDVLIIGTGISGIMTAIVLAENNISCTLLNKDSNLESTNTNYAQGGIAVLGENDSFELMSRDILYAGGSVSNYDALDIVCKEGDKITREYLCDKIKVPFDTNKDGAFQYGLEASHSTRRILHVKDYTGHSIQKAILKYASSFSKIKFLKSHAAVDLIVNTHSSTDPQQKYKNKRVIGAYLLNCESSEIKPFFASSTVIATGGIGNLYLYTSNPPSATGDGIAMAYRSGCNIINAEYVQFHPTLLYSKKVKRMLLTEALRGEGAKLKNIKGEYFMEKYHHLKELAPRDEVSRAIYNEMEKGGGFVYLDATLIEKDILKKRFQSIHKKCFDLGIDIEKNSIPIVPAAHYFCGGIKVDMNSKTQIDSLYAVGEASCNGVHGANRLASISLLEALTFGVRAALNIVKEIKPITSELISSIPDWQYPGNKVQFDPTLIKNDLSIIKNTMWSYVGIVRSKERLKRAVSDLGYLDYRIKSFYDSAEIDKSILELRNSITVSKLIAEAALFNKKSLGCHFVK